MFALETPPAAADGSDISPIRAVIDPLRYEQLDELPDERLERDFAELQRAVEELELERLRRLAEIERRGLFARHGHLSVASWLASRFRVAWGEAKTEARVARSLEHMPSTRAALRDGEVSLSAARVLARVRQVDPEAFGDDEAQLVEAARIHSMSDLHRVAAYWRQQVEQQRVRNDDDGPRARRALRASVTFMGMVRVDGDLDPETGETLLSALGAVLDAEARSRGDDRRTMAQRRADALGEVCRQWLDGAERPQVGGERPHVSLMVDIAALEGEATDPGTAQLARGQGGQRAGGHIGVMSELGHIGPVPPRLARQLACDASIMRVVMAGGSEPLDVGRRTAIVSPAMRRAVIARDRHCRFPGCDRPSTWCDAHHVVHWADGGPTSVANLLLLCRRHHRMVHARRGFSLRMVNGRPEFRRPDGSSLGGGDRDGVDVAGGDEDGVGVAVAAQSPAAPGADRGPPS